MDAKLIPVLGVEGTEAVPLQTEQPVVLGRGNVCTVRLGHGKVSRLHCRISYENGFYTVEDLDSKNGTWVNNRRIEKAILFDHDRITVGGAEFRFVLEGSLTWESTLTGGSTDILLDSDGEAQFETEIREPANSHTPSSLFIDMPRGRDGPVDEALERELAAVCKVINAVNAECHPYRLFATIMDSVMEVTDADRGYLIILPELNGVRMPLVGQIKEGMPPSARKTFSRSIVAECYETGDSILRCNRTNQPDPRKVLLAWPIQSVICVPMRDKQGTVGVIYVDSLVSSRHFTKRHLKVLTAIGNQAGIALRRVFPADPPSRAINEIVQRLMSALMYRDADTHALSRRATAVALYISELLPDGRPDPRALKIASLLHPIAAAIRHHHERWDGTGYPDGLAREDIPLAARILAIAEEFDSMASDLPYREALVPQEILAELIGGAGTQFDPNLVGLFVKALQTNDVFRARIREIYRHKVSAPLMHLIGVAVERGLILHADAEDLFARLEALPSEQQTVQWLAREAGLTEVQVSELQPLLEAADAAALARPQMPTVPPPGLSANKILGGYKIIREIGRGGMGVVYEAEQEARGRRVALKLLLPAFASRPAFVTRFYVESRALSALNHPNIVTIMERGTVGSIFYYFVMELVRGIPTTQYCHENNLPTEERLALFMQVCSAVHYAHRQGVIHGDLKPGHILVQPDGQPKVLGFGRAKLTELPDGDELRALTTDGQVMGIVAYMAPEQTLGQAGEIDIRTDVYALGVVLYEGLTGQLPYDVEGADASEAMRRVREEEPTPPSAISPLVDAEVETILLKALAKEKKRRYQSADALAADIGHYLAGEAIEARRVSAIHQQPKLARRYRAILILSAVALVAAVVVAAAAFVRARSALDRAVEAGNDARAAHAEEARQRREADAAREGEAEQR